MILIAAVFFSLISLVLSATQSPNNTACVVAQILEDGSYDFAVEADTARALLLATRRRSTYEFLIPAAVWFNNSIDHLGMAFQTVKTSGDIEDYIQAYWAGYLELYISRNMTTAHFENTWSSKLSVWGFDCFC